MAEKDSKISSDVAAMAEAIKANVNLDFKTGTGTETKPVFEACLPEDLPMETVKRVNNHNANFVAAGGMAFGELSVEAMTKHPKLEKTDINIKMAGTDHVEYRVERTKEYNNHLAGEGAKTVKHGVLTTTYNVKGGTNSGQLKHVRDHLGALAQEALGKK